MEVIKNDARGGLNGFIAEQQENKDPATFTLIQFDHLYEVDPVRNNVLLHQKAHHGDTSLLDAVMRATALATAQRGIIVVYTDGYENSSKEATKEQVAARFKELEARGWKTMYLGAGQKEWADALGFQDVHIQVNMASSDPIRKSAASASNFAASTIGTQNYRTSNRVDMGEQDDQSQTDS